MLGSLYIDIVLSFLNLAGEIRLNLNAKFGMKFQSHIQF